MTNNLTEMIFDYNFYLDPRAVLVHIVLFKVFVSVVATLTFWTFNIKLGITTFKLALVSCYIWWQENSLGVMSK